MYAGTYSFSSLDRDKTAFHAYLSGKEVIPPTGYGTSKSFAASINPVLTAPKLSIKIAAGVSLAFRGRPISDFADFLQIF